jgi:tRNA nucleotidyltransferase (CCA-adding enzyme)
MIEPFLSAVPLLEKLEEAGFEAYFVGGSVRDYLIGSAIHDVDIATSATPVEVKKVFSKTVDIGIEHGTVLVLFQNGAYEVTTFRAESEYLDFRHPKEVSFIRNLKEDLERRDFTMNAIAMDKLGEIKDPFSGQAAIKERMIRTVGSAEERFREDALRMMRAVRFVSQLSFAIEENTYQSLKNLAPLLSNIAIERKKAEFDKLLSGPNRIAALELIIETQLYKYLPGLKSHEAGLKKFCSYKTDQLDLIEMWVLLVYCLEIPRSEIEDFLRNWRLPIKEIRDIQHQSLFLHYRLGNDWDINHLYLAKRDSVLKVEKLHQIISGFENDQVVLELSNIYDKLPIKDKSELDVTGTDLMEWYNRKGGPWLKDTLTAIEDAILSGKAINEKEKIREWLLKCNQI